MRSLSAIALQSLLAVGTSTALRSGERADADDLQTEASICKSLMVDAISLQDSSGSMWPDEWEKILTVTSELIDALEIGEKSRLAPISFSSSVTVHWYLDDERAQNAEKAKEALRTLSLQKLGTNTGGALKEAYKVFSEMKAADPSRYSDPHLVRLVLLTTDGCCNWHDVDKYTTVEAQIQAELETLSTIPNVVIFAIGIGENICVDELRHIAGCRPSSTREHCPRILFVDFEHIESVMPTYIEEACAAAAAVKEASELEEGAGEEPDQEEREEGGNNAAAIAGGVVGGLLLCGGVGGGAYAYSKSGSTPSGDAQTNESSSGDIWDERESSIPAGDSMFA